MKKKIENPKIFISYAWGDEEYQNQVLAFASQLVGDGIEVVFDKWDLTEGNDTYAFMEKCATDPTITNVLMLLDPIYAKKADEHSGGVGTETQIISAKVYSEVTQDKFIPVVMKRDENDAVCKPTYLQGRLHFDLSRPEEYDETYQRLVKTLYGEEIYAKPELGKKPAWVDKPVPPKYNKVARYNSLKNNDSQIVKSDSLVTYLNEISERIVAFSNEDSPSNIALEDYVQLYDSFDDIRVSFLELLKNSIYVDRCLKKIGDFFEETENAISLGSGLKNEIARIRIHEMFLYTIAGLLKAKDYASAGYLLNRTYLNTRAYGKQNPAESFQLFYSGSHHQNLDNAIKKRDDKNYYSGTAQHWIETIDTDFCTKEQFILADLICLNVSIYGTPLNDGWPWFPVTYVYDNEYNSVIGIMGKKLVSKEFANDVLPLFGYEKVEDLKAKFKEVEMAPRGTYREYRFSAAFDSAHTLGDFIKSEQIASVR